jgi:hypothetical protein
MLAACGLFDFGVQPPVASDGRDVDAPVAMVGHDEDGDGLPDDQDPCPALAGTAADSDGDGVGDACDPHPSTPGDQLVGFYTMQPGDVPFDTLAELAQEPDAARWSAVNGGAAITRPVQSLRIELGYDIHALVGTGQHQIAMGIDRGSDPYYFSEVNDSGTGVQGFQIVSFDATNGYVPLMGMTFPAFHAGVGHERCDVDATAHAYACEGGWTGELYTAAAATPAYAGGSVIRFAFNGIDVSVTYLLLISTP